MFVLSCSNPFVDFTADSKTGGAYEDELSEKEAEAIVIDRSTFTLAWNPPSEVDGTDSVYGYRIYYRPHGEQKWFILDTLERSRTEYTVIYPKIDYGEYEFAVASIQAGDESDLHTSLDTTATPGTGWYLEWRES